MYRADEIHPNHVGSPLSLASHPLTQSLPLDLNLVEPLRAIFLNGTISARYPE